VRRLAVVAYLDAHRPHDAYLLLLHA